MKLLLDTHTLYWWTTDSDQLSTTARTTIRKSFGQVHVSVASAWEIAIKVGSGKWPEAAPLIARFEEEVAAEKFHLLAVGVAHVRTAGLMQSPHRDPFDRLLAAQAMIEGLTLVTADEKLQSLGAPVLW